MNGAENRNQVTSWHFWIYKYYSDNILCREMRRKFPFRSAFDDEFPNVADETVESFQRIERVRLEELPTPMLNERAVLEAMAKRKQTSGFTLLLSSSLVQSFSLHIQSVWPSTKEKYVVCLLSFPPNRREKKNTRFLPRRKRFWSKNFRMTHLQRSMRANSFGRSTSFGWCSWQGRCWFR